MREPVDGAGPHDLHLAVPGGELRRCERQRSILHDEPAREHGGEHGRAGDDADRHEDDPFAPGSEARAHEPERVGDPNELRHQ